MNFKQFLIVETDNKLKQLLEKVDVEDLLKKAKISNLDIKSLPTDQKIEMLSLILRSLGDNIAKGKLFDKALLKKNAEFMMHVYKCL